MNIDSLISRLQTVSNELMTISSFQRIQDMSGKRAKPCSCRHHKIDSIPRCPGKCNTNLREKKKIRYSCREPLKLCSCTHDTDDQLNVDDKVKEVGRDHKSKETDNENEKRSPIGEKLKQVTRDMSVGKNDSSKKSSETLDDRIFSAFQTPGDIDIKPQTINVRGSKSVAVQMENVATEDETLPPEKSKENTKNIEKMYKELSQRNLELEEQLKNMSCSLSCLKEESEKQAACLKDALEKAKKEASLASRSRNLAMDLAKQSREQTDFVKASKDELLNQINVVQCNNTKLECECEELRCKFKEIKDNEAKKCSELEEKINKIQCASKESERELVREKCELKKIISLQKKRICDLTSICTKQKDLLRENEDCISIKLAELAEAEDRIKSSSCKCRQMQEQINDLECRLKEATIVRESLKQKLDECRDSCDCELQIKNKIIGDQIETIKKLKKLLQDSEKMAHQAACEFESLRDELHCLKQSNKSLRMALDEVEERTSDESDFCDRCNVLEARINNLEEQKQKAMMAAKIAAAKLCKTTADYERQLNCEKRNNDYMNDLVERQITEIQLLKKEILCVKEFRSRRSNDFINH